MATAAVLKGTRDFLPTQIAKREYLFDTIRSVYRSYGFLPIETPAMERSETLLGKYGEEGDRLIFKVLNNGDFMSGVDTDTTPGKVAAQISKRAMRYDLTVPFARFVSQHRNDLTFPFKRYQIQPVWRADRPQKGRYQEFFQCDADVVGSDALLHEAEFIFIFDAVLSKLGLKQFSIKLNNRKILSGMAEVSGCEDSFADMAIALDKLDKIGMDRVKQEWLDRGLGSASVERLAAMLSLRGDDILNQLEQELASSEIGLLGVKELREVSDTVDRIGLDRADLELDLTLARGLDYYTGAIFEVTTTDMAIGSICGGGRYDDLTGIFGLNGMSGVGISFGADRIYDVLEETDAWPQDLGNAPAILFVNFGEEESKRCLDVLQQLRKQGISGELYPSSAKMKKQMKYADDKGIAHVALIGSDELASKEVKVKNMKTGVQESYSVEALQDLLAVSE